RRCGRGGAARRPDPLRQPGRCLFARWYRSARAARPACDRRRDNPRHCRTRHSGDRHQPVNDEEAPRGITFRAMIPNGIAALALAVSCALRLARFNARLEAAEQPHKSAGFNTGVPAPAGAGLAFVPMYLWLITGDSLFQRWELVMAWTLFIAALMISSLP